MPDLSVIIPVYNRGQVIRYTLESVDRASRGMNVETILVDDGSTPPTQTVLDQLGWQPSVLVRQENRGLLFARLAGLKRATGRYVVFLDSDDLVGPDKFRLQLGAMDRASAEVSYTDVSHCTLEGDYDQLKPVNGEVSPDFGTSAPFFLQGQPAPHGPIFRTSYLQGLVDRPFFPPSALYNPVAEIWFYYNAAARPSRVVKVPGFHTIVGVHAGARLTNHWERLGVASLAVMEAFARAVPATADTAEARELAGNKAFISWRKLPRGFSPEICERHLAIWRSLASGDPRPLGGSSFVAMSRVLGAERTGRIFRWRQNGPYEACRTLTDQDVESLLRRVPAPKVP
jgi:glycosyltransferase involved in cell wall biosynthesis